LLLRMLQEKHSLDRPRPASATPLHSLETLDHNCAADDLSLDLLAPHATSQPSSPVSARRRDHFVPSTPDRESPRKAAAVSTPPRSTGLERTARDPTGASGIFPQALPPNNYPGIAHTSSESLSSKASQMSLQSEVDLGAYVDMHCGRGDNAYARRVGVDGDASSDETSESGSPLLSSRSATQSHTPSMYSTGSLHEHLVPRDADVPLCKCRRRMGFFRFCEENHVCDNTGCDVTIEKNTYGWHCADCSMDLCSTCFPHSWTPIDSFASSAADSAGTMQLDSLPSQTDSTSPLQAAPRLQASADAAAFGRGHNA
jgi:hypothetical protein